MIYKYIINHTTFKTVILNKKQPYLPTIILVTIINHWFKHNINQNSAGLEKKTNVRDRVIHIASKVSRSAYTELYFTVIY